MTNRFPPFPTVSGTHPDRFPPPFRGGNGHTETPPSDTNRETPQPELSLTTPPRQRKEPNPYTHLATTTPRGIRTGHCHNCGAPIIRGTDADYCAAIIRADTTPLNQLGELICTIDQRNTYTLITPLIGSAKLYRRTAPEIRQHPVETPQKPWHKYDVLPEHNCTPTPPALQTPTVLAYTPPKRIDRNEPAPY